MQQNIEGVRQNKPDCWFAEPENRKPKTKSDPSEAHSGVGFANARSRLRLAVKRGLDAELSMSTRQLEIVDREMATILARKTETERLQIAWGMWRSARNMITQMLRAENNELSDDEIQAEDRLWIMLTSSRRNQ